VVAPRALRDCAPAAPSGVGARPLNFTVRREDMRSTLPDTPRPRDSLLRVILVGPPRGLWHFAAERNKE
jgi:hypothetical protein